MLGKRPRRPMKRTTSMTGITFDLNPSEPSDHQVANADERFLAMVSPRGNHRRYSADYTDTAHFLRVCCLCHRLLVPDRDIYMYRGDSAFCSLECRQEQMTKDDREEKCLSKGAAAVASAAARSAG